MTKKKKLKKYGNGGSPEKTVFSEVQTPMFDNWYPTGSDAQSKTDRALWEGQIMQKRAIESQRIFNQNPKTLQDLSRREIDRRYADPRGIGDGFDELYYTYYPQLYPSMSPQEIGNAMGDAPKYKRDTYPMQNKEAFDLKSNYKDGGIMKKKLKKYDNGGEKSTKKPIQQEFSYTSTPEQNAYTFMLNNPWEISSLDQLNSLSGSDRVRAQQYLIKSGYASQDDITKFNTGYSANQLANQRVKASNLQIQSVNESVKNEQKRSGAAKQTAGMSGDGMNVCNAAGDCTKPSKAMGGPLGTGNTVGDQYYWATLNKDRANVPAALNTLFSKGDYSQEYYTNAVVPDNNALDAYGTFNLQRHWKTEQGMRKQMKEKGSFKKGGKMAYCKDGGEIDFTYIFSKELGTADKTQKVMRDLGGRLPSDYLHVVSGPGHPANGSQGGAQFDSSMRPVDNSTLKFNGATAGNRSSNRTDPIQPGAVAFLENEETFINPKYSKGTLPFGVDPIAKNTADRLFSSIEAENEQLRMKGKGGKMKMYNDGGLTKDGKSLINETGMGVDPMSIIGSASGAITGIGSIMDAVKLEGADRNANIAAGAMDTAGSALGMIPGAGPIIQGVLGLGSSVAKLIGGAKAKKEAWQENYSNKPMALTENTVGNQLQGYKRGGKMPMYGGGKDTVGDAWAIEDWNQFLPVNHSTLDDRQQRKMVNDTAMQGYPAPFNPLDGTYEPADMQEYTRNNTRPDLSGVASSGLFTQKPSNFDRRKMPFTTDYSKPGVPESFKTAPRVPITQPDQFGLTTGDKLMLGSMLPATLFNAANFAAGYDKEKAILNPEANKIKSLMDQKIDFQAMLNESRAERNRTEGFINRSTDNQAVRRSNLMQVGANSARANSSINLQGQVAQNQLDTSRAQMLDQLGRETMQAKETARELTARNKGQWLNWGSATAENIGEGLSRTGTAMNTREMNNLKLSILNSLPGNYSTSKDQILKAMEGMSPEQLIAFNAYAESITKKN